MKTIQTENWSLELPEDWEVEQDDICLSVWQSDGVGALQFSTARKDSPVTDSDLLEFAEDHLNRSANPVPVTLGEFSGFELCYEFQEIWWRLWFLRAGSTALFITYNCNVSNAGFEADVVDAVLANLKR